MDIRTMLNKIDVKKLAAEGISWSKDHLPAIFSASALGCLALGVYETAKATHKSDMDILKEEARRAAELPLYENTELSVPEKVNLCWRNYIKPACYVGACAAFIIAAERKNHERYVALLSAYELAKQAGSENDTRKRVEEALLGEDKAHEIDREVARVTRQNDIQEVPGKGVKTLYLEPYTNTPFWATHEDILHAFNYINYVKGDKGVASISKDFLGCLELRDVPVADDWGWNEDDALIEPDLDETTLVDEDPSLPATIIGFSIQPRPDYGNDRRQWRHA